VITFSNVEAALDNLNRKTPDLFSRSLLIGGWCALLYYRELKKKNDPEYPAPIPENKDRLQSNDLDFTNVWKGDYFDALPELVVQPTKGAPYLEVAGVRLGFAQAPEALDPVEAFEKSRKFKTQAGTKFAVLDPVRLYRGKQAMIQKGRGKANDPFHLQIASIYAKFELAEAIKRRLSKPTASSQLRVDRLAKEMKDLAPELLSK
jgi:hypothetical protein